MKILLLGEYSNVHNTLKHGLEHLGHSVTVISNGDFWKNYPRDIDAARRGNYFSGARLYMKLIGLLPRMRGYDIVQLINPMFFELKAERLFAFYRYLKRYNKRIILGAFGMDYYWVSVSISQKPLRYSDFNIGNSLRTNKEALYERHDWIGTAKEKLNRLIAKECDAIVSGLYEYDVCYRQFFPDKTHYIPYPIVQTNKELVKTRLPINVFIGINPSRNEYKGTDIMLRAARFIVERYPNRVRLHVAEGVPFAEYEKMMNTADILLDQLYSYTPSMNTLLAMSKGVVCLGGGELEHYELLNEKELRPIVNVTPSQQSVYEELERLVQDIDLIDHLKRESVCYIARHHDYIKVSKEYERLYLLLLNTSYS